MNKVFGPLKDKVVMCYVDDLLVPANDWEEMKIKLKEVFEGRWKSKLFNCGPCQQAKRNRKAN